MIRVVMCKQRDGGSANHLQRQNERKKGTSVYDDSLVRRVMKMDSGQKKMTVQENGIV